MAPLYGSYVWVYRNLRHGKKAPRLYSVVTDGRVVARVGRILLTNCHFIVRESGRRRYLQTGHKNVHAFVRGWVADSAFGIDKDDKNLPCRVTYDPSVAGHFFVPSPLAAIGTRIDYARVVLLNEHGISVAYAD